MKAKVGPNKTVPIANGKIAPAISGPSASPSHGSTSDPNPGGAKLGGHRLGGTYDVNKTLVAPKIGTSSDGADAANNDHGQPSTPSRPMNLPGH